MKMSNKKACLAIIGFLMVMGTFWAFRDVVPEIKKSRGENEMRLPPPQLQGSMALEDALGFKKVLGKKISDSFDVRSLGQLLWSAQGITHTPFRSAPSAGATYPLELYILPRIPFESLSVGLYHYVPSAHSLERVESGDVFTEIVQSLNVTGVETAPVLMVVTAAYERTTSRYGERGIQYVHLEVGHVLQNLLLQAKSLNVALEFVLEFDEELVSSKLNLEYKPLALVFFWKTESESSSTGKNLSEKEFQSQAQDWTTISVEEAIASRRSIREYAGGEISASQLTRLLDMSYGRKDPITGERVFHSVTGSFPVNIRISVTKVAGLDEGIYFYDDSDNSLTQLSNSSRRQELWAYGLKQNWIRDAQVALVLSINLTKLQSSSISTELQKRIALFEVGMIAQNIYLEGFVLGLGTVVVGAFDENGVRDMMQAGKDEIPIYIMPVGRVSRSAYQTVLSPTLQFWSGVLSLFSFILFFLGGLVMSPAFRTRLRRQATWLHYGFSVLSATFGLLHVVIAHGLWTLLVRMDAFLLLGSVIEIFSIPFQTYYSVSDIGLILAKVLTFLFLMLIVLALPLLTKTSLVTRYRLIFLHKFLFWMIFLLIILHAMVNGYIVASYQQEFFVVFLVLMIGLVFLYLQPRFISRDMKGVSDKKSVIADD